MWELLNNNLIVAGFFLLIVVPLYSKLGLLDVLWKKNGKNGNGKHTAEEIAQLIVGNHLHETIEDIRDLKKWQADENVLLNKIIYLLEDIKKNTTK